MTAATRVQRIPPDDGTTAHTRGVKYIFHGLSHEMRCEIWTATQGCDPDITPTELYLWNNPSPPFQDDPVYIAALDRVLALTQ